MTLVILSFAEGCFRFGLCFFIWTSYSVYIVFDLGLLCFTKDFRSSENKFGFLLALFLRDLSQQVAEIRDDDHLSVTSQLRIDA